MNRQTKSICKIPSHRFVSWCVAETRQRERQTALFAGCNLAVIAVQMTGRMPNIKEWISPIYTLQVCNHGLHVVGELLGCNLASCRIP